MDKVVFNTEAHPLPRFDPGKNFFTGWKRKPRDPATGQLLEDLASVEANQGQKPIGSSGGGNGRADTGSHKEGGVRGGESVGGEVRGMSGKGEVGSGKASNRDEIGDEGASIGVAPKEGVRGNVVPQGGEVGSMKVGGGGEVK